MDGRRFDSFAKSLARSSNRRGVLKGLFGLGGVAAVGGRFSRTGVDAARRSTPTPKPVTCPGLQQPIGGACACPGDMAQCGSDCCRAGAECCDGACCDGHCYGEELCCASTSWCDPTGECCPAGTVCRGSYGCLPENDGACGNDDHCPAGFTCCGDECCASGFCSQEGCCALGVCGSGCLSDQNQECCGGVEYVPGRIRCCAGQIVTGTCCDDDQCDREQNQRCVEYFCLTSTNPDNPPNLPGPSGPPVPGEPGGGATTDDDPKLPPVHPRDPE